MNRERYCGPHRQPCPSPYLCSGGCEYEKWPIAYKAKTFSNPGFTHTILDAPGNFWDRCGVVGRAVTVFAAVLACALTAGLIVGFTQ